MKLHYDIGYAARPSHLLDLESDVEPTPSSRGTPEMIPYWIDAEPPWWVPARLAVPVGLSQKQVNVNSYAASLSL